VVEIRIELELADARRDLEEFQKELEAAESKAEDLEKRDPSGPAAPGRPRAGGRARPGGRAAVDPMMKGLAVKVAGAVASIKLMQLGLDVLGQKVEGILGEQMQRAAAELGAKAGAVAVATAGVSKAFQAAGALGLAGGFTAEQREFLTARAAEVAAAQARNEIQKADRARSRAALAAPNALKDALGALGGA
jgi:hypothetical protein